MILADTSIWIDHLRRNNRVFAELLRANSILCHPFVIGEVALGHLTPRETILVDLQDLPRCTVASDSEVLEFIDRHSLYGRGIGYVDVHLLASITMRPGTALWTLDKRLNRVAEHLGVAMRPLN